MGEGFKIGELAKIAGVGVETIRFYERKGLLAQPPKPYGGCRRYDLRHLERVRFIKRAQRLGFTLSEIALLLRLEEDLECREAQRIATEKLREVQERLSDLSRIASLLKRLLSECKASQKKVRCPILFSLQGRLPKTLPKEEKERSCKSPGS
jgi:MerR family mercuric resistance operon transcriptional regulator